MDILLCTIMLQNHKWDKDKTPDWEIETLIPRIAPLGYDGVEMWGFHLVNKNPPEIKAIKTLADQHRLKIGAVSPYFNFTRNQTTSQASLAAAEKFIGFCDILDCHTIRVFTGGPASDRAMPEHWQRAVQGCREMCRLAGSRDLVFVVETHANQLADTIATTLRLVHEIDHPKFKVNFQPSTFRRSDPVVLYDQLVPHVAHIHMNNFDPQGQISLLADGVMNFSSFLLHLKQQAYQGTVAVEFTRGAAAPAQHYDLEQVLRAAALDRTFIRSVLQPQN